MRSPRTPAASETALPTPICHVASSGRRGRSHRCRSPFPCGNRTRRRADTRVGGSTTETALSRAGSATVRHPHTRTPSDGRGKRRSARAPDATPPKFDDSGGSSGGVDSAFCARPCPPTSTAGALPTWSRRDARRTEIHAMTTDATPPDHRQPRTTSRLDRSPRSARSAACPASLLFLTRHCSTSDLFSTTSVFVIHPLDSPPSLHHHFSGRGTGRNPLIHRGAAMDDGSLVHTSVAVPRCSFCVLTPGSPTDAGSLRRGP